MSQSAINDVVMAETQGQLPPQIPAAISSHPSIVYRGVLVASLNGQSDVLQRGNSLHPHIPFELIDLPTGKARSVKARTLRFRAVNVQTRWRAELCSHMEQRIRGLLPSTLNGPGPTALFLPRTRNARIAFMDIMFASQAQYRAVLSCKERLMLLRVPQGASSIEFELAFEGACIDEETLIIQVSDLPDSADKLAEFERVALRVGVILDLWKQVRSVPESDPEERPTGTYFAVVRLYPHITDQQIGDLPGWLVCDNPYQGYVLSYSGRRPWCNHCNWRVRSDERHIALHCPVVGEAATERKKERNRQKRQKRRSRRREQQSESVEMSEGAGSSERAHSTGDGTGSGDRIPQSSTIVGQ